MKNISLVVSILFFIALGFSLYQKDLDNSIFQAVIGSILLLFSFIFWKDEKMSKELLEWIIHNQQNLSSGSIRYKGIIIDEETEFLQYEVCLSIGFLSFRRKTGYYIKEHHPTVLISLMYTTFTIIFGWWAIPMGPFNTIRAIGHNIFSKPKHIKVIINELK